MVEITNREELEAWLGSKGRDAASPIAARAALRVLPLVVEFSSEDWEARSATIVLPMFRAIATSWFVGRWPKQELVGLRSAIARSARFAADSAAFASVSAASTVRSTASAAESAASAADSAASAARTAADSSVRYPADSAIRSASLSVELSVSWQEIFADADRLDEAQASRDLMRFPLWSGGAPLGLLADRWRTLKHALLALDTNWQVWTDWYDDRLRGFDNSGSRPLIEGLERARVLIPNEDWDKGPKHVNALIAELEAENRANTPQQKPAIIEVAYGEDNVVHRLPSRPPEPRDDAQDARLREAWAAHTALFGGLEALNPGRNAPALAQTMQLYRAALGENFEELRVIALGVHGMSLEAHAAHADETLLDDAKGALVGMAASHGLFIRQFYAWLEYLKDTDPAPSEEVVEAAVAVARVTREIAGLIGEDVAEPLNELADVALPSLSADPADRPATVVQSEFLRSLGNVLSVSLAPFVTFARDAGARARKGALDGVEESTKSLFKKVSTAILFGGSALALAAQYPAAFGWLTHVVTFLRNTFGV